jgi:hypothetical protein
MWRESYSYCLAALKKPFYFLHTSLRHRPSLYMLKSAMQQHFLWQAMLAMSGSASMITMAPSLYPRQSDPNSASCDAFTSFKAACASATLGSLLSVLQSNSAVFVLQARHMHHLSIRAIMTAVYLISRLHHQRSIPPLAAIPPITAHLSARHLQH